MSSLLTIQMLIKNNEDTIDYTFDSLMPLVHELNAKIIVGNLGCTDQTVRRCEIYGAEIISLSLNEDLSHARNYLMDKINSPWTFYIEPYETIFKGTECFAETIRLSKNAYKANILQGDVVTPQIRLWHRDMKLRFKNPVFETIIGPAMTSGVYISVAENKSDWRADLAIKWLERCPISTEPLYYVACSHLSRKNWPAFMDYANMYLHQEKTESMSAIMTRYYCSMVKCYIEKDYQEAIRFLLPCLACKPLMSEFWCLLADIYYAINQYEKARSFYENAIILGCRRLKDDDWPMEISKYKKYPEKMMDSCDKIKQTSRIYKASERREQAI